MKTLVSLLKATALGGIVFLHRLDYVSTSKQLMQDLENQLRHFDDTD